MSDLANYNFAYLDEQTKRMIRRAILKAIAIPGYQVPFASREMPMPYGWGTGGVQVTAAILGPDDVLKVIDQGADGGLLGVGLQVRPARLFRHPEHVLRRVLVLVLCSLRVFGQQRLAPGLEGIGDVFQEDQPEGDMLVVAGLHVAAQFVGGLEQFGLETEVSGRIGDLACRLGSGGRGGFCGRRLPLAGWLGGGSLRLDRRGVFRPNHAPDRTAATSTDFQLALFDQCVAGFKVVVFLHLGFEPFRDTRLQAQIADGGTVFRQFLQDRLANLGDGGLGHVVLPLFQRRIVPER